MQVFKAFFKVLKKNMVILAIYIAIFVAMNVGLTLSGAQTVPDDFRETKAAVAVLNDDRDSELVRGFTSFLAQKAQMVEIEDEPEALQDALFFRKAEYIIRIPPGFTDSVMAGTPMDLTRTAVPDSTSAMYMDMLINSYVNTAGLYARHAGGLSQAELADRVESDLLTRTEVTIDAPKGTVKDSRTNTYFNFSAYTALATLLYGVSSFMLVINDRDMRMRNLCAPLRPASIVLQSLLGSMVFAVIVWAAVLACGYALFGNVLLSVNGLLWAVNLLVFTLVALSMSFLIGTVIRNRNAQKAAANTISLGMSFLGGVMVPQGLLSGTVLGIASFTPVYWFVKANDAIAGIVSFNSGNVAPIIECYLIELGFAAVFLSVTLLISRQRKSAAVRRGTRVEQKA
jgi:ABC-2 type transport system permease protein